MNNFTKTFTFDLVFDCFIFYNIIYKFLLPMRYKKLHSSLRFYYLHNNGSAKKPLDCFGTTKQLDCCEVQLLLHISQFFIAVYIVNVLIIIQLVRAVGVIYLLCIRKQLYHREKCFRRLRAASNVPLRQQLLETVFRLVQHRDIMFNRDCA